MPYVVLSRHACASLSDVVIFSVGCAAALAQIVVSRVVTTSWYVRSRLSYSAAPVSRNAHGRLPA